MEPTTSYKVNQQCAFCNETCTQGDTIVRHDQTFCCFGCATLYDVQNNLGGFEWSDDEISIEYKQYDLPEVFNQLVDFQNDKIYKVSVSLPEIHCSSCVELLEDLPEFDEAIHTSHVNFEERTLTVTVGKSFGLAHLSMLLDKLGYPPQFNVSKKASQKRKKTQTELLRKVAVAGFCFGNSMMFSMPHYFGLSILGDTFFAGLFRYLNVGFSVLVLAYPARDYFVTAYQSVLRKKSHIDIPIVLGILAIWIWSMYEIFSGTGFGYLDSLAGLIFFLLVGKWYQNKVYSRITFERSIHDFLPISVRRNNAGITDWVRVNELSIGDIVEVKNGEVIPVNGVLKSGKAVIDYSFVTGESVAERTAVGQPIFIGGKQTGSTILIEITEKQDTAKIWSAWKTPKKQEKSESHWTTIVSMYFTPLVLLIAFGSLAAWYFIDASKALFVFSSVLIVACPCALALSTPFTLGSIVRVLSKNEFYLKSSDSIEKLAEVDHIVFDKTGTLTDSASSKAIVIEDCLTQTQQAWVKSIVNQSNHPLSQGVFNHFKNIECIEVSEVQEIEGKGIQGIVDDHLILVGSAAFIGVTSNHTSSEVYVSIDGDVRAHFGFGNQYRKGIKSFFKSLSQKARLSVLSGDNDSEADTLKSLYPHFQTVRFNNSPNAKKAFIDECHSAGDHTMMIGDGLNDQVALHQSDIGIAVANTINGFYPSSDGILVANSFEKLPRLLELTRYSGSVLKTSLAFSVFYNLIGIAFAVAGSLTPIVAAILMPLSSITVVGLVTALVSLKAKKLRLL